MTFREQLAALGVGESKTFPTREQARSAQGACSRFYDGRRFTLSGLTITRIRDRTYQ